MIIYLSDMIIWYTSHDYGLVCQELGTMADLATSALCAGGQNVVAGTMADLATSARGQKKEAAQPPAAATAGP